MSDEMGLVARLRQSAELFEAVRAMHAGAEGADAEPHWSSQGEAETAHDLASEAAAAIERLVAERDEARAALRQLVNAKAISGVREVVAGWNGENRPEGPYKERHPPRLGATLPKTDCGSVYELDEAMQRARQALGDT